ncbi:MAG: Methionyl-tRNA formyltransferase [Candidatus Nomurabacteria bacterium GW2011_GWB1_40_7]|uniref:Methionyl-tRNA formyltransferase n=1 Tax=Candidatus Nomurabacteria bacterium GW2011_GWB1_40_7 TaxID=1618744 RepID=A0A0G0T527_9BACT|nr:MAG: Methionyl-tRNA formyltransferase [Candidatus Nomurabacteria bacterium GW2011_GWB1_40_7]
MVNSFMNKLNFVFWGTPEVASETLEILKENGYLPSLIVTSPDRPQGRKMLIAPPPAKIWAIENNIPYIQPESLNQKEIWNVLRTLGRSDGDGQRKFSAENFSGEQNVPDFFLVVAYGKIIPEDILNMPKLGSINVHYSLLPKYRGASPVESAILNGDTKTGVTIQKMEYKMDSGPIIATEETEIAPDEKAPDLRQRLTEIGGKLLLKTLPEFINGKTLEIKQDENEATFCKKIKKEDGLIDLNDEAIKNYNKFRAYAHWPRTFFFKDGKRVIITNAVLENGKFVIKKVLPEGKKEISWEDFNLRHGVD